MAFQIGQCLGLLQGIELYSKEDMAVCFPELEPYFKRMPSNAKILQEYKTIFVKKIKEEFHDFSVLKEDWKEKHVRSPKYR